MDFEYSAASHHWFAINLLINFAKAAIYLFSFSVVFLDVYELWTDVGYERLKIFTLSQYGLFYTTSLSSRDRLHHVVLLASLAVLSMTAVGAFSILGLMSQTRDFHLHLSEIVTGLSGSPIFANGHHSSLVQKADCWLGTILSTEQPTVNIFKRPGTFFWAQQYHFALLSWCLYLGFEAPVGDHMTTLQTLAYLGIGHFNLSLSQSLYFIRMILSPRQTGKIGSIKEASWLRNVLTTSLSLLAMVAVIRTHREENANRYITMVTITSIIPFLMTLIASSRTTWLWPTTLYRKSKMIGIAAEKSEKSRHFQTVCWTAFVTHMFGILAALGTPNSSTKDHYYFGNMSEKGHMGSLYIGMQNVYKILMRNPSGTAMTVDCLLTLVALCIFTSAAQLQPSNILSAAVSLRFDKHSADLAKSVRSTSRRSPRLSMAGRQSSASTPDPAESSRRSSARQSSSRLSRSRSRGPSASREEAKPVGRSSSRSRTRSVSRSRHAQDDVNEGLRARKGRRDRSPDDVDQELGTKKRKIEDYHLADNSVAGIEAVALAILFWLFGGLGSASAAVLGADRGGMV